MGNTKNEKLVLDTKKLKYETTKPKKVKIAKEPKTTSKSKKAILASSSSSKRRNVGGYIVSKFKNIYHYLLGVVNKIFHPKKKAKKLTKIERENAKNQRNRGIMGIGQLLVVVSIAYSTAVILIGVGSLASIIALVPQVIFALVTLIKAFSKLYK